MPTRRPRYKRLVIGLQPNAADRSMRIAAELAELLQLEMLGLFVDDRSLYDLARFPFVRELRSPGGGWQPIDIERVSREIELVAGNLKRTFERATGQLAAAARFEVARGSWAESIAALSRTDDIVVVAEPVSPAERVASQFAWMSEAAFRSAAAVLLVPARIRRSRGAIVAIAAERDDPCIHLAALIAIAAKEELIIIDADHHRGIDEDMRKFAAESGLQVEQIVAARSAFLNHPVVACAQAFHHVQERLVVMSRDAFDPSVASTIAATRQVPVLIVESSTTSAHHDAP